MEDHETAAAPRYQPAEVRRQQILDAAAHLAVSEGLESATIAKVAKAAGVAKGSIYLHFESRDDLIAALQTRVWQAMMASPRRIAEDQGMGWATRLDAIVEHWMRYEFEHHALYHAVFHAVATESDEPWHEARTLLRRVIEGGAAAGEFSIEGLDLGATVDFLLHGYIGPCFHTTDPGAAIANVQLLFRRALGAEVDGARRNNQ